MSAKHRNRRQESLPEISYAEVLLNAVHGDS